MTQGLFKKLAGIVVLAAAVAFAVSAAAPAANHKKSDVDWTAVGKALGIQPTAQSSGVWRIDIPRTDLKVTVPRTDPIGPRFVQVKPFFALGGYLVFLPMGGGTQVMMMGDLVLTEGEIEPVLLKLEQGGVAIAAIHNHLLWEKPTVMYVHVMVMGDAVQLATAVHNALALTHTPLTAPAPNPADSTVDLDTGALDQVMGVTGKVTGGVYKYSVAPAFTITGMGQTIPPSMGMSTALAFQALGKGRAAVTGDYSLLGNQINPVIRALQANEIHVTALHSHLSDMTPNVFFMHFYATGDALKLAQGLRAGLDAIKANPGA